ncbi:DNA polymerase I [Exiguobacterium acetylicum]|uniref:DNA polymerase I n=1 Tax=Exiguobacterium TaxID=33986 RepID=UPI00044542D9|nr:MULTISPECIES: DNA polymerase I [Exiguobacterium]EZP60507.1 DNA polymerase [Exiguobacterium sp. RIT341]MDQ6467461.1 DNA polymerase I [Exiguobacterium acetylicum]
MMENKLLLIDGNSLTYRAFFALPPMTDAQGRNTNAAYGFTMMLLKLLEEEQPTHMLVAFDASSETFRHDVYQEYKGSREKTPSELREQFPIVRDICEALGIQMMELHRYEADDLIGTLARTMPTDRTRIVTGDKDLLQLVTDKVEVLITKRGITDVQCMTEELFAETYGGLKPIQMIDLKGLMGDKSDNIPGIPGIGEKTAVKLISAYGSVEGLYEHVEDLKGKQKEKVIANEELARLSKELATIKVDVPLETTLDDLQIRNVDTQVPYSLFQSLGFKSLTNRFAPVVKEEDKEQLNVVTITSLPKDVTDAVLIAEQLREDYMEEDIIGFAIATPDTIYVAAPTLVEDPAFRQWIESEHQKICLDAKQVAFALRKHGLTLNGYEDLLLAGYLLNLSGGTTLASIAGHYALMAPNEEAVLGKGAKRLAPEDEALHPYLAEKARMVELLFPKVREELKANQQYELYETLERPLSGVLAEMEWTGIRVDVATLQEMQADLAGRLTELETLVFEAAGESFNINSPKQLGVILFEKLELPAFKKTKTGYSTAADVLEKLRPLHPVIDHIMLYRELQKLQSTYVEGLQKVIKEDGKIHTRFAQTIAQTGRLSSVNPNLQNIPIRIEEGRKIRKAFVPSQTGWSLYAADYSQIELRVMADMSQDQTLVDAFLHDEDIHTQTASSVFGVEPEDVTGNMRRQAKAVNFGIIYGISDYGLSQNLNITRKEAQSFIDRYFELFPQIKQFMDTAIETARANGFVETLMNRRRNIPDINSKNFNLRGFAERTAINTPIQGSAADIIKKAMLDVHAALKASNLKARLLLQVHDELIFEAPDEELDALQALVKQAMEQTVELSVPLRVDGGAGHTWYETK